MAILIGGARFSEQASLFQTLVDANVSLFRWLRSDPWGPTLLEVLFVTLVVQGVATTRTKSNRKDAIRFYLMGHQNRITAEVEQLRVLLDQSTETKDKVDSLIASLRRLSREVASAESTIEQVDLTLFERHQYGAVVDEFLSLNKSIQSTLYYLLNLVDRSDQTVTSVEYYAYQIESHILPSVDRLLEKIKNMIMSKFLR